MFMESFKYYKSKNPPPKMDEVLNFHKSGDEQLFKLIQPKAPQKQNFPGTIPLSDWQIHEFVDKPGLVIIKNPFTPTGQRYWMCRSVQDYHLPPNHTNLGQNYYSNYISKGENISWWEIRHKIENQKEKEKFVKSLRWTTLGYHYDWTNKIYDEKEKNEFPSDLSELTLLCAQTLGYSNYRAEAAIVNYYPIGSTLSGHTDHSEKNLEAPLFSFSFGQSAIFLIGGETKEEKPLALLLKSGDIIVMTRESRLCYHAVPRVFKAEDEPWNSPVEDSSLSNCINTNLWNLCKKDSFWSDFNEYASNSRININVRQVLKEAETHL